MPCSHIVLAFKAGQCPLDFARSDRNVKLCKVCLHSVNSLTECPFRRVLVFNASIC